METIRIWLQTAAIIVALGVFITREYLEHSRRIDAKTRKVAAIKIVLARACELNHWTIKSITRQLNSIRNATLGHVRFSIVRRDGQVAITEEVDGNVGSSVVPEVYSADFKSQLLPIAEIDAELTALLETAITGLAELNHVRDSMIRFVSGDGPLPAQHQDDFLQDFADYGISEIDDTLEALKKLYLACTGEVLQAHRLR